VYDFQPISVGQLGFNPAVPRHDLKIQLNRDAVRLHAEVLDQSTQRSGTLELVIVPVNDDLHVN
jgi:hypothetical protein